MSKFKKYARQTVLGLCLATLAMSTTGCHFRILGDFVSTFYAYSKFWKTTPLLPVSAYFSELIEDTYHEEERYDKVPILDPVEGEHAPLFCLDPPSADEVMRSLPDSAAGGLAIFAETQRNNVRITVEPIVDRIDECRFFPLVGPARLHHCHYKCTVYYDKTRRSDWPVPFETQDSVQDVVYIDHDHLIRCAGAPTPE